MDYFHIKIKDIQQANGTACCRLPDLHIQEFCDLLEPDPGALPTRARTATTPTTRWLRYHEPPGDLVQRQSV